MYRKHALLLGVAISMLLLMIAVYSYPGGSRNDIHSVGFDWQNNYLSNLFDKTAINGSDNTSRIWAVAGWFLFCASFAVFFIEFSRKIVLKSAAGIIRYCGATAMFFAFLAVTPYHDTVLPVASTLGLLSMFYITMLIFKSRLHFLKILSVIGLLVFYAINFIYYSSTYLEILPIMQKISLVLFAIWVLSLQYFTQREDFQNTGSKKSAIDPSIIK